MVGRYWAFGDAFADDSDGAGVLTLEMTSYVAKLISNTERHFKGEQRRVVKRSSFETLRILTSSTKNGRANNAWNAALVSETRPVKGIPVRTSFRSCVSMPGRWGKAAFTWGQSESRIDNMEQCCTEKWSSRM